AEVFERHGAEGPALAAAVLDPYGTSPHEPVQHVPIEGPCDRLVVADRSDPLARGRPRVGGGERRGELLRGRHRRRSDVDGPERRGERGEVDVVVVEAG